MVTVTLATRLVDILKTNWNWTIFEVNSKCERWERHTRHTLIIQLSQFMFFFLHLTRVWPHFFDAKHRKRNEMIRRKNETGEKNNNLESNRVQYYLCIFNQYSIMNWLQLHVEDNVNRGWLHGNCLVCRVSRHENWSAACCLFAAVAFNAIHTFQEC